MGMAGSLLSLVINDVTESQQFGKMGKTSVRIAGRLYFR